MPGRVPSRASDLLARLSGPRPLEGGKLGYFGKYCGRVMVSTSFGGFVTMILHYIVPCIPTFPTFHLQSLYMYYLRQGLYLSEMTTPPSLPGHAAWSNVVLITPQTY